MERVIGATFLIEQGRSKISSQRKQESRYIEAIYELQQGQEWVHEQEDPDETEVYLQAYATCLERIDTHGY